MPQIADRIEQIAPFYVMDILARAKALEAEGHEIIHLEVGEPDFSAPETVVRASLSALQQGLTHYTPALGLPELRQAIATFYDQRYNTSVQAQQVAVTPGASGALQLILGAIVNVSDEVLMADPGYPCNRHFVRMFGGQDISIPVDHDTDYQLMAELAEPYINTQTKAIMVASPSNPTGTLLTAQALKDLVSLCEQRDIYLIVDEIYLGLTYDVKEHTAAQYLAKSEHVIVINSFSKYFGMTGMRAGWLLAPECVIKAIDKQAQNFFLATATPAQYGALAAFEPETIKILEQRRNEFQSRRDYLLPELKKLGFKIAYIPQGAFYLYADCTEIDSKFANDSYKLCEFLLDKAGVAITPGKDFGEHHQSRHVRLAYTRDIAELKVAVKQLQKVLR